jgi:hypothetical protein
MRLTWRDGATTVLAALTVVVMLALTQAWSWPMATVNEGRGR